MTQMQPEKIQELDTLWDKTDVLPVVTEHDTGITSYGEKKSGYSNFCPEISFDAFGLFANYLHKYADEIDRDMAHTLLEKDAHAKDWRWRWEHVSPLHYLKCSVYSQLLSQKVASRKCSGEPSTEGELVEIKPSIGGISLNIKVLLTRIAKWWLARLGK